MGAPEGHMTRFSQHKQSLVQPSSPRSGALSRVTAMHPPVSSKGLPAAIAKRSANPSNVPAEDVRPRSSAGNMNPAGNPNQSKCRSHDDSFHH